MLTASGNAENNPEWQHLEQKLFAELHAVLSKPEYGAVSSWFRGIHLASSAVHQPAVGGTITEPDMAVAQAAALFTSGKRGPGRPRTVNA
jgi:hypothetical protein